MINAGVLTISDKGYRGQRTDSSGPLIAEILTAAGYIVEEQTIVPDNEKKIAERLIEWVDKKGIRLVVTTGGTGLSPTDVTPEAMLKVIKYLCTFKQSFCWNTSPVQAYSSNRLPFYDSNFHS
jgi:molybdenum cofactor synthesis domain-containing protein